MMSTTAGSHGCCGGLPNSVISAPAKKVWPSQAMTTALALSSASASAIASTSPWRTAVDSAFTGGLLDRTISTSPCLRVEIGLVVGASRTSVMGASGPSRYGAADRHASGVRQSVSGVSGQGRHGSATCSNDVRSPSGGSGSYRSGPGDDLRLVVGLLRPASEGAGAWGVVGRGRRDDRQ